jgi:hypothetical protein
MSAAAGWLPTGSGRPPRAAWCRRTALDSAALLVHGRLESNEGAINLLAAGMERLRVAAIARGSVVSRNFR